MIDSHTFENLILTNTIVAAFCIVLLVTFTVFIILLLIPLIRRRWIKNNPNEENLTSSLSRQPSFHQFTLGPSRLNPLFEPTTTTTTTQFGTLFHPHATATTLLHPTIWSSINPPSLPVQTPPTSSTLTKSTVSPPPIPIHSPTTSILQRPPKKQ